MLQTLTPYDDVPFWAHMYIYSRDDLNNANFAQKQFYKAFKKAFINGIYYDLCGNTNYCFILLFDLLDKCYIGQVDLDELKKKLDILSDTYPETTPYATDVLIKLFVENKRYAEAWSIKRQFGYYAIDDVIKFESLLNRSLVDNVVVRTIAGVSGLTPYGRVHADEIFALPERAIRQIERDRGVRFSSIFIKPIKWDEYDLTEYEQYYTNKKEYDSCLELDKSQTHFRKQTDAIPHTVRHGLQAHLQTIVRQSENEYRENMGLPKIGEGWIGETELYYFIKELLPKQTVIHHARPEWLKPQHLDILIQDYNIAIEYQGEQHYRPIDYFGGQESFDANVKRDAIKKEKCDTHDCLLICVDKSHTQEFIKKIIHKAIKAKQQKNGDK